MQPIPEEVEVERPQRQMTLEDFWRTIIQDETGHPSEDPNEHMGRFIRMENTVKLNGVRPEVIKLQLFPFSLRDVAATWFESLPIGSVNNWEELVEAYMSRFFLLALTYEMRGENIVFKQGENECFYNAWERCKRLLKRCPMHGINLTTKMDIFIML